MKTIRLALLPVDTLWEYREFKRDEIAAPCLPFIQNRTMEEIMNYVGKHGMEPVELSIIKDHALLTDGNHRIVVARRLGHELIPVNITVFIGDGSDYFHHCTLSRFQPIAKPLKLELKKIFLNNESARDDGTELIMEPRAQEFKSEERPEECYSAVTSPGNFTVKVEPTPTIL